MKSIKLLLIIIALMSIKSVHANGQSQCPAPFSGSRPPRCPDTYTIEAVTVTVPSGITHRWYTTPTGGSPLNGPSIKVVSTGDPYITTITRYFPITTTLYVSSYNVISGCESARTPITVNIKDSSPPTITPSSDPSNVCSLDDGFVLTFSLGDSYQWTRDGVAIPGGTNRTYHPVQSGHYSVQVTGSCGQKESMHLYVTVNLGSRSPSVPTISTNACGNKILTRDAPPNGITWYWQGNNATGVSTSNSSTTYVATSSGFYYIRARNNSTGCWGNGTPVNVTMNPAPSQPTTPTVSTNLCGDKILTRGVPPSGITWYWQGTNSGGTSMSNSLSTYTAHGSGTYYLRARNNITGCWSNPAQYRSVDNISRDKGIIFYSQIRM